MKGGSREYKESTAAIAKAFGIELAEVPDWNCCGATAAHNLNKELSLALPARILALAEKEELSEILVPCAACYNRLSVTQHELNENEELKKRICSIIGMDYKGTSGIINILQMIEKYIINTIDGKVIKPFNHLTACYYGCLLVRPHNILKFDRPEDPVIMDNIIQKIGGTPVDWAFKVECCGAGLSVSRTDLVARLSGKIVEDAVDRGSQVIVVACPMCHLNLDMRRPESNKFLKKNIDIPVIYITQALGLALGISEKELGLQRHYVPVVLKEKPADTAPQKPSKKVLQTQEMEA
jgi:heterodisulfide reductase subunit B